MGEKYGMQGVQVEHLRWPTDHGREGRVNLTPPIGSARAGGFPGHCFPLHPPSVARTPVSRPVRSLSGRHQPFQTRLPVLEGYGHGEQLIG